MVKCPVFDHFFDTFSFPTISFAFYTEQEPKNTPKSAIFTGVQKHEKTPFLTPKKHKKTEKTPKNDQKMTQKNTKNTINAASFLLQKNSQKNSKKTRKKSTFPKKSKK